MKKTILTILLLVPFLLPAQHYKNICTQGLTFYKVYNANNLKAYRIDSIGIPVAGDTLFKSFRIMIDTNYTMCGDTTKGSILGRKVYKKNNGWFYFFNKLNDTIFINTQASLNSTWVFFNLSSATFIQATLSSVSLDTVLGVLDSVKTFTLQGKRDNGQNILTLYNGKTMKISQHYGLSKTFNMVKIPNDTTWYTLSGKTHPAMGTQDFGWKDVYNYQVGDLFHYHGHHTALNTSGGVSTTWISIKKVLTKTIHGNNDSVTYTLEHCKRVQVVSTGVSTDTYDTITERHNFVTLANDSSILRMPDEFIRANIYSSGYDRKINNYLSRQTKEIDNDKYRYINNCWVIPEGASIVNDWYSVGLGVSEYYKQNSSFIEDEALSYYKKGSETWGTPVATDCNTLVSVEEAPVISGLQVRIIPNPVNIRAEILINGFPSNQKLDVALYDFTGRMIYHNQIGTDHFTFDRSGIANGLYILRVMGATSELKATAKIVIE